MSSEPAFEPIAVVGRACTLPGAVSPEALWEAVLAGRDLLTRAPAGRWGACDARHFLCRPDAPEPDRAWSDRGGYVAGFEEVFDPRGFLVSPAELAGLDPLFLWTVHTARAALADARLAVGSLHRAGAVLGNLSFPTLGMARYAEAVWAGRDEHDRPDPRNRFGSGLPALLLERALGLDAGSFALDAACASSLYAIRYACDALHDGRADLMLAGAVNRADDLFLHVGFAALGALSVSGRSRPFHAEADGLVPAEGAAFVVLERLEDALRHGRPILGLIRAVGLSNDGRGKGFLVPSAEGQERAMRAAYQAAGVAPETVGMVECHATGTQVGDGTELRSLQAVFGDAIGSGTEKIPIGSIKSNLGHPITAAGAAGLIKTLEAMRAGVRPPTLHVDRPLPELEAAPLRLLAAAEPWDARSHPRRAGVSAFGFGGNNAHLVVEEWRDDLRATPRRTRSRGSERAPVEPAAPRIAIVGVGVVAAGCPDRQSFAGALFDDVVRVRAHALGGREAVPAAPIDSFEIDVAKAGVPPSDLRRTHAQQLLLLDAATQAAAEVGSLPKQRTGVFAGMGVDPEIARYGARWRLAERLGSELDEQRMTAARDAVVEALDSAGVVGTMPNIVANRVNRRLDLGGASCAVSAEEASGLCALALACRALGAGELDAAIVGAVDLSCEPVHRAAARACLPPSRQVPGDAAVALVVRRLEDALREGDEIYAVVEPHRPAPEEPTWGPDPGQLSVTTRLGHAHAASGLLHVAAAALSLRHRILPGGAPWLGAGSRSAVVHVAPMPTRERAAESREDADSAPAFRLTEHRAARRAVAPARRGDTATRRRFFHVYDGADAREILTRLDAASTGCVSARQPAARLVIVADDDAMLARRLERARRHLRDGAPAGEGVFFRARAAEGEIAFVFASAGTAYAGMGRDLLRVLPELGERVNARFGDLEPSLRWALANEEPSNNTDRLWGASAICRLHAELTTGLLGLRPHAAIGYSSGESTSLFALGAWTDIDAMRRDIEREGLFDPALGGAYEAVARAWGLEPGSGARVEWEVWSVLAEVERVRELLRGEERLHLAIVHTARNCVVAGDAAAARRFVETIGRSRCRRLDYDVAAHVPEVGSWREPWLRIHRRRVAPVPGVRFYSAGRDGAYQPSTEACAQAILGQAVRTLDFPQVVEQAWRDGVRVFVEHGPQGACASWIREILGERAADCAIVSLDRAPAPEERRAGDERPRSAHGIEPVLDGVAALLAAGVALDAEPLERALTLFVDATSTTLGVDARGARPATLLRLPAHPPPVRMPGPELAAAAERMEPAPALPPVLDLLDEAVFPAAGAGGGDAVVRIAPEEPLPAVPSQPATEAEIAAVLAFPAPTSAATAPIAATASDPSSLHLAAIGRVHREFLEHQARVHARFLAGRSGGAAPPGVESAASPEALPVVPRESSPAAGAHVMDVPAGPIETTPSLPATIVLSHEPASRFAPGDDEPRTGEARDAPRSPVRTRPGFALDRAQLEIHASGRISEIFGPVFEAQDGYARQVRMPEPPLLLADRMTAIDATPGVQGRGAIWTETDVHADSWYLHRGRVPAGLLIEAGQADLMLISYMGADLRNRGERVYRLLGCELTYLDELPRPGATLEYEIRVDGHAEQDGIRLFFFQYDCEVEGRPLLRVRGGQAGFFTDEELRASAGVLWSPRDTRPRADARLDPPAVACARRSFDAAQVQAFAEGRPWDCFGDGFELAKTHTDTPRIQSGDMLFLDRVPVLDLARDGGGPWGRGYLRAEADVTPDEWYFAGHFKNDPCMPGTLMFEGCVQAMSFLMAAMGFGLERDGWRFQPVIGEPIAMRCRGQVTPRSEALTYEVFVEEVVAGPIPTLWADVLCTVDGLKAFHARRVGLQLVPSWPLENEPRLLAEHLERARRHPGHARAPVVLAPREPGERPLELGYESLLACAWGRPSDSFGSMYRRFDGAQGVPRLPGPPYHFVSRVVRVTGEPGGMRAGSTVDVEYDVPAAGPDAWYFADNGARTMPWAVLLEAVLQPCGWLASYAGCALATEGELRFRNLDGEGTVLAEVLDGTRPVRAGAEPHTLRTHVELTGVSRSGSTTIVRFAQEAFLGERRVLELRSVFGFFPPEALANQAGLPASDEEHALLDEPSDFHAELGAEPPRWFGGTLRLASGRLRMLDRVTGFWPGGGEAGLGRLRAERDVDAGDWYFRAHFYQDPVQPGSLGVEAMLQLLQFFLIESGAADGIPEPRFEAIALGAPVAWKCRGQVLPGNERIAVTLDVTSLVREPHGVLATAKASLWCDGKRIYAADSLGMRVVSGAPASAARPPADAKALHAPRLASPAEQSTDGRTFTLDPAADAWLGDHRPTWCRPALPMMVAADLLAAAVPAEHRVVGLRDVEVQGWIDFPAAREFRTAVDRIGDSEWRVRLFSRLAASGDTPREAEERAVASARVVTGAYPQPPRPLEPIDGAPLEDPYATGDLFHGSAFQLLRRGVRGPAGASTWLALSPRVELSSGRSVPRGRLFPALLDAALHGIPHDRLHLWLAEIGDDRVAYPIRIPRLDLYGPPPEAGEVRCEVRCDGFLAKPDLPRFRVQLSAVDPSGLERVWAELVVIEACFPKGPLGSAPAAARRAFLRDHSWVEGVSLSRRAGAETRLGIAAVEESDWLPGTVEAIYGTRDPERIAAKEHLAARHRLHPRILPDALPLGPTRVEVLREGAEIVARDPDAGSTELDLGPVARYWSDRLGVHQPWLGQDLMEGLVCRYVRRVVLEDPAAFATLGSRGAIFAANHQVQIESILVTHLLAGLCGRDVVTLANAKHRTRWIGWLVEALAAYPGIPLDRPPFAPIVYFDQADRASLPRILAELAPALERGERSFFFHAAGTRSTREPDPVERISSVFLDLAVDRDLPIVPVRFTGGLVEEPVAEKQEVPLGHARQDYVVGRPIEAGELRALPYAERRRRVLEAMSSVAGDGRHRGRDPQPRFEASVAEWRARRRVGEVEAILFRTLEGLSEPSPETHRVVELVRSAASGAQLSTSNERTVESWLGAVAARLAGS